MLVVKKKHCKFVLHKILGRSRTRSTTLSAEQLDHMVIRRASWDSKWPLATLGHWACPPYPLLVWPISSRDRHNYYVDSFLLSRKILKS